MYDRFWQRGYHPLYEFPFRLANGKFLFPDFLLIHPQIPYLYIVEHLGLWFHPEMKDNYRKNYLLKEEPTEPLVLPKASICSPPKNFQTAASTLKHWNVCAP